MKDLIILGYNPISYSIPELQQKGYEVWAMASDPREGADRYYGWYHAMDKRRKIYDDYPAYLSACENIPLNNPISNMLYIAWKEGYTEILLFGSAAYEDSECRCAIGMTVAYLRGKGIEVQWIDEPYNTHYGRKLQKIQK